MKTGRGDVMFCPAYWHDNTPEIYDDIKRTGCEIVILVHDLLPITFPDCYNYPWRDEFKRNIARSFSYTSAFFCVSNYTRTSLIEFMVRNRLPRLPMMTAYNGFEPLVPPGHSATSLVQLCGKADLSSLFGLGPNPLIMVGSIEPKKGHVSVVEKMEALWDEGYSRKLVIIGRIGWLEAPIISRIRKSRHFGKDLFWLFDIDDLDLAFCYENCHALVFSSLGEGFGIPMIEAASFDKPSVVLDTPIAREVLGNAAVYFDNREVDLVDCVQSLEDPAVYRAAKEAAARVGWPTWDEYTPEVLTALARVADDPNDLPEWIPPERGRLSREGSKRFVAA